MSVAHRVNNADQNFVPKEVQDTHGSGRNNILSQSAKIIRLK